MENCTCLIGIQMKASSRSYMLNVKNSVFCWKKEQRYPSPPHFYLILDIEFMQAGNEQN